MHHRSTVLTPTLLFITVCVQDEDRTVQTQIVEMFERRKDKLRKRETYPQKVSVFSVCAL